MSKKGRRLRIVRVLGMAEPYLAIKSSTVVGMKL